MKSHKLILFGFLFLCISCTNESDEKMKVIHKDNPDFQTEEYRKIFLDGTHNTRELGGYETKDGKKVKMIEKILRGFLLFNSSLS